MKQAHAEQAMKGKKSTRSKIPAFHATVFAADTQFKYL